MKRGIFIIFFLLSICMSYSATQESQKPDFRKGRIGVSFSSFGQNTGINLVSLDGGASYENGGFFVLGLNYAYPLNRWLELESGIEYARHGITIVPAFTGKNNPEAEKVKLSLIGIPLTIRANFLKYGFVNGGLHLDLDTSSGHNVDNQTGLGVMLGAGVKYDFNSSLSIFVNPYIRMHALLPFMPKQYHLRICDGGFRIGISYNLSRQ